MANLCDKIGLFVDGELPFEEAEAFRLHLPDCTRCQHEMANLMQLKLLGRRYVAHARPEQAQVSRPSARMRWKLPMISAAFLAAAALMLLVVPSLRSTPSLQGDVWLAEGPYRPLEDRLSYPGASAYRPPPPTAMGGNSSEASGPRKKPSHSVMARLEESNKHGLATVYLAHKQFKDAEEVLRELRNEAPSPELDCDLAVALQHQGTVAKTDEALQLLEDVLEKNPHHPQALWNRGLMLRELGLALLAARAFSEVSALKEPGWSEEAADLAKGLGSRPAESYKRWKESFNAGEALLEAPPGPQSFDLIPDTRRQFYDAIRAAPSRERVLALRPLAQKLDEQAGGNVLEGYVLRTAEKDFARRAPLARRYPDLVRERLSPEDTERFLAELLKSGEDDILLGALVIAQATPRHLELYEQKAAASGDPWFKLLAAQERAKADLAAARWKQAAKVLLDAGKNCPAPGLAYRCIFIERELSSLYLRNQLSEEAHASAMKGLKEADSHDDWGLRPSLVWNLNQSAKFMGRPALSRAYVGEFAEYGKIDPARQADTEQRDHEHLAAIAMRELQEEKARREINAAIATGLPLSLNGALALADIARLKPEPTDEEHLNKSLESAMPTLTLGEKVIALHVRGRFLIKDKDRAEEGRALLRKAITEAEAPGLKEDRGAWRARVYSFSSLIHDAGQRGDFKEALEWFGKERRLELPGRCLLAASMDSERLLFVALGPTGELSHFSDEKRRQPLPESLDGLVPKDLVASLRPCEQVEVVARPPLHGRAELLPSDMAWSYLTRTSAPREPPRTGPAVHLVVANVDLELPPDAGLERLNTWTSTFGPDEKRVELSGREATPSRVLREMRNATEIDLVTHGIISEYSDASYLLLAPDQDGPKLGASRLRAASLQGAPFVVLAACHAARASYSREDPFSLPSIFIEAGARGVLASTKEIPDREAEQFFNAIRKRMREGMAPKLALREERVQWLRKGEGETWIDSVLLFE